VACWGEGSCGQLGSGSACGQCGSEGSGDKTTCAGALTAGPAVAGDHSLIAAGARHTCLARPSGEVSCWGDNGHWQVVPALSQAPAGQSPFVAESSLLVLDKTSLLALGSQHGCALRKNGEVWCWGSNTLGQLGRGDQGDAAAHESPDRVQWSFRND
jgi:alpha-tubulin suppressor-like RCC1 family protein